MPAAKLNLILAGAQVGEVDPAWFSEGGELRSSLKRSERLGPGDGVTEPSEEDETELIRGDHGSLLVVEA